MKTLIYSILIAVFFIVPSYAAVNIQMLDDWDVPYSMMILEDGFAGYSVNDVISTFCVEKNEYFNPGYSYEAVINTEAVKGGVSGGNPDPLSYQSAYLFTQYLSGNSAFNDASKLQDAIWYFEGEIFSANDYVGFANDAVLGNAELGIDPTWSGYGNIRVANLFTAGGAYAQDQLISINPVPVPGALVLSGIGTVMVGWLRRRIR